MSAWKNKYIVTPQANFSPTDNDVFIQPRKEKYNGLKDTAMKKIYLFILTFLMTYTISFSQQEATTLSGKKVLLYEDSTWTYAENDLLYNIKAVAISKLEIPQLKPKENVIAHAAYSLSYNEPNEQANWVAYELTSEETISVVNRTDNFIIDPLVKTKTANDKDYSGSGYDRGHLAPAGDMGYSTTAMTESFYYSNMSPQDPGFNRGIWKRVEELIRTWAIEYKSIYIVTGPVLTSGLQTIGPNKVSVPKYFYKVILDYTEPGIKGIGFIIANTSSKESLQTFAVTIDSVEKITGINFFSLLRDDQENTIESYLNIKAWTWKNSKTSDEKEKLSSSVLCKGMTKKGEQCKNKTLNTIGYCYLHEGQISNGNETITTTPKVETKSRSSSVQCSGTTKKGARCKNITTNASGRCYLH